MSKLFHGVGRRSVIAGAALAIAGAFAPARAFAFDISGYKTKLAALKTEIGSKELSDAKATLGRLDELMALGATGTREYAAKQPKFTKLMDAVVADMPNMKGYSDAELEEKWGEQGSGGDAAGVPLKSLGQFDETRAAMELILGPATAYIYVNKWTSAKKVRWLEQARDELAELEEHLKQAG